MSTATEVYTPPAVAVGTPVRWFHGANRDQPHAAFITKSGAKAVQVCVVQAGSMKAIQGVLHISDPDLETKPLRKEAGAWDFLPDQQQAESPSTAVVAKLTETVKSLEKRLKSLEDQLK